LKVLQLAVALEAEIISRKATGINYCLPHLFRTKHLKKKKNDFENHTFFPSIVRNSVLGNLSPDED